MADFTDGVKEYVEATALVPVKNYFPVDFRGNPDMSCYQCNYFNRNNGKCIITNDVTSYPQKFVGRTCPFREQEEEDE